MGIGSVANLVLFPLGYRIDRMVSPGDHLVDAAKQRPLYVSRHGEEAVTNKRFYNIGSGSFHHPFWSSVDMPSDWYARDQENKIDVIWDISKLQPIPVDDGVAEVVYTSHTIEHLTDSQDAHLFAQGFRILRKGGVIRVTCPDIRLYYEAYRRNDPGIMLYPNSAMSIQDQFLNEFASQLTDMMRVGNPQGSTSIKILDQEVDRVFDTMPFDEACDHFTAMCDYEIHKKALGAHINWWHFEKIERFLRAAGFRNIRKSAYGQSFCPVLRNTLYFDNTSPAFSIYVEAEK